MSARPLETFQSEGWYRPGRSRSDHYFRPSAEDAAELGTYAMRTLCGSYASGGGHRPWLMVVARRDKACTKCGELITAQLLLPSGSPWFASLGGDA